MHKNIIFKLYKTFFFHINIMSKDILIEIVNDCCSKVMELADYFIKKKPIKKEKEKDQCEE